MNKVFTVDFKKKLHITPLGRRLRKKYMGLIRWLFRYLFFISLGYSIVKWAFRNRDTLMRTVRLAQRYR